MISQGVSGAVCFIYMFRKYDVLRFQGRNDGMIFKKMGRLLSVGLPMALQFSITAVGSVIMQAADFCFLAFIFTSAKMF